MVRRECVEKVEHKAQIPDLVYRKPPSLHPQLGKISQFFTPTVLRMQSQDEATTAKLKTCIRMRVHEQCGFISVQTRAFLFMKKVTSNEPCLPERHVGLMTPRLFISCGIQSMFLCIYEHITADSMQKGVNW